MSSPITKTSEVTLRDGEVAIVFTEDSISIATPTEVEAGNIPPQVRYALALAFLSLRDPTWMKATMRKFEDMIEEMDND